MTTGNAGDFYFYQADNGVRLLKNRLLDSIPWISAAFSTRRGGVSTGECATLNLSWKRRDSWENVKENHRRLANAMDIPVGDIAFARLVHGDSVLVMDSSNRNDGKWWQNIPEGYDSFITADRDVALLARTADCGTVLMCDTKKRIIAAVHSGWKGTSLNIIGKTVETMHKRFGCCPADIIAVTGPSICKDCFLVHDDCASCFRDSYSSFITVSGDRYSVDLKSIIRLQLAESGINPSACSFCDLCTCCDDDNFFSHRRGKGKSGIMLAVIEMK